MLKSIDRHVGNKERVFFNHMPFKNADLLSNALFCYQVAIRKLQ